MGRLVIDGKNVYEIDEECARRKKLPKECGIYEHLNDFDRKSAKREKRKSSENK